MSFNWEVMSDRIYSSPEGVRDDYQKKLKRQNQGAAEQAWVDDFLAPIINLMGTEAVWNSVLTAIYGEAPLLKGIGGRANSRNDRDKYLNINIGWFSGAHWTSHFKGDGDGYVFDPYDTYQYPGTNQFCQTFALMYLVGQIDGRFYLQKGEDPNPEFTNYYAYTAKALEFIKIVISDYMIDNSIVVLPDGTGTFYEYSKETLLQIVTEYLIPHKNRCFNVIELPYFSAAEAEGDEDAVIYKRLPKLPCNFNKHKVKFGSKNTACDVACIYPFLEKSNINCEGCPQPYRTQQPYCHNNFVEPAKEVLSISSCDEENEECKNTFYRTKIRVPCDNDECRRIAYLEKL